MARLLKLVVSSTNLGRPRGGFSRCFKRRKTPFIAAAQLVPGFPDLFFGVQMLDGIQTMKFMIVFNLWIQHHSFIDFVIKTGLEII